VNSLKQAAVIQKLVISKTTLAEAPQ